MDSDHRAETAALVALLRSGARPPAEYSRMLETAGPASAIAVEELGLLSQQLTHAAELDIARWNRQGIRVLTLLHPEYPENLLAVHDHPPLLFVAGHVQACDARAVAVIGSRRASSAGIARAQAIAETLVSAGYAVTSGLAAGIDTAAHSAALDSGGRTLAVVGTGLHHAYPSRNAPLQRRIATEAAVISRFWPEAGPTRQSFPVRNALMSGLTLATVVVEATHTSGARTQVRAALAQARPVLLTRVLLEQRWAAELAARPGVHVVDSPADVVEVVDRLSSVHTLVA